MSSGVPDNHVYYFAVGAGAWTGRFSLDVNDWSVFWRDGIGLKNRFLTLSLVATQKLLGSSSIDSTVRAFREWGSAGVATNVVRIKKFGLTLYLLKEEYILRTDGTGVSVRSRERFGPIPFLFRTAKRYPAEIHEGGRGATYLDMPILGTM